VDMAAADWLRTNGWNPDHDTAVLIHGYGGKDASFPMVVLRDGKLRLSGYEGRYSHAPLNSGMQEGAGSASGGVVLEKYNVSYLMTVAVRSKAPVLAAGVRVLVLSSAILRRVEDESNTFLRDIGDRLQDRMASQPRTTN
jgi:hypothetical protein